MNKKILSIFVVALFAFSAFVVMDADDSDATPVDTGIWINGEYEMTADYDAHWADQGWKYEGNYHGGTLILNNASLNQCLESATYPNSPIYCHPDLGSGFTVELHGNNTINVAANSANDTFAGISASDLTFTGDGTLTITVTDTYGTKTVYGLYAYNLALTSGTIIFSNKDVGAYNICCDYRFEIGGAGAIYFNYDLAQNDELIYSDYELLISDAIMSDNVEVVGNYVKATSAGPGWIGYKSSTITFDGNGGTPSAASMVTSTVGKLTELPSAIYEEHIFQGWFTAAEGGTEVTTSNTFKSDMTVYAQWIVDPNIKTITFDANGGTCATTTMKTGADKKLASLPDATKDGYTFDGWYTAADGGDKITTSTEFDANTTVYAHWTETGGEGGSGSGGINWNPDFDRLLDKDLRLIILLAAVTVLSLLIMGSYVFGKKN